MKAEYWFCDIFTKKEESNLLEHMSRKVNWNLVIKS